METKKVKLTLAFRKKTPNDKTTFFTKMLNNTILFVTRSKYYHVEIIIDDVWVSSSWNRGGFSIRPLRPIDESKDTRYDYVHLPEREVTVQSYDTIMEFIKSQEGTKYDVLGIILSQLIPLKFHSRSRWFCSEAVTKILQLFLNKDALPLEPQEVNPGTLAKLYGLEKK